MSGGVGGGVAPYLGDEDARAEELIDDLQRERPDEDWGARREALPAPAAEP